MRAGSVLVGYFEFWEQNMGLLRCLFPISVSGGDRVRAGKGDEGPALVLA